MAPVHACLRNVELCSNPAPIRARFLRAAPCWSVVQGCAHGIECCAHGTQHHSCTSRPAGLWSRAVHMELNAVHMEPNTTPVRRALLVCGPGLCTEVLGRTGQSSAPSSRPARPSASGTSRYHLRARCAVLFLFRTTPHPSCALRYLWRRAFLVFGSV